MYQVLARKWRPRTFDELVGQQHVSKTLSNAIEAERLAHAYIFAGLRGTGKTTVARILAKCLNCEKDSTVTPCGECDSCLEITESRSMDVLEIDAASRTKVEQTRELLEVVTYAPVRDRYKVLIIDEAHMLSKASFNALLKTLEEPPPNVVFLLATTEVNKILPTILSRCQVFDFRRVSVGDLVGHLGRIAESEGIEISADALDQIARAGEGSVRDSLSVLERVLAFCGSKVGDDDVLRLLGGVRAEVMVEAIRGLAARDAGKMLSVLDSLAADGQDLMQFWSEWLSCLRDLMVQRILPERTDLISKPPEQVQALVEAAAALTREDLTRAFQMLADLELGLKTSSRPRFLFESAVIRLSDLGAVLSIEQVLDNVTGSGSGSGSGSATGGDRAGNSRRTSGPGSTRRAAPPPPAATRPKAAASSPAPPRPAGSDRKTGRAPAVDRSLAGAALAASIAAAAEAGKPMLGALLGQVSSADLDGEKLTLRCPTEAVASPLRNKDAAETIGSLVGVDGPVEVVVSTAAPEPTRRDAGQKRPGAPSGQRDGPRKPERSHLLSQATEEPGVKKLLRELGAQVIDIRPLEDRRELAGETPPPAEDQS